MKTDSRHNADGTSHSAPSYMLGESRNKPTQEQPMPNNGMFKFCIQMRSTHGRFFGCSCFTHCCCESVLIFPSAAVAYEAPFVSIFCAVPWNIHSPKIESSRSKLVKKCPLSSIQQKHLSAPQVKDKRSNCSCCKSVSGTAAGMFARFCLFLPKRCSNTRAHYDSYLQVLHFFPYKCLLTYNGGLCSHFRSTQYFKW